MTEKFGIYIADKKIHWSTNKIIYTVMFLVIGLYYLLQEIVGLNKSTEKGFQYIFVLTFFIALISKFINFPKVEKSNGRIDGYITFLDNEIVIKERTYLLNEIKKIKISNDDYLGRLANYTSGNFGPALSDGTNNHMSFFFESGESKRYRYQLLSSDDFQKVRDQLINYHQKGKIDFWELADVLGEKSAMEIAELTKQINSLKASTATNTG
jgi:hypothetical protein